jgi:N-acetylglutamate synthase-like GNAT family acetyltransferase
MLNIRWARAADVPLILALIRELAEYEKLADAVVATEEQLGQIYLAPGRRRKC